MTEPRGEQLAREYAAVRPRLLRMAYAVLGSWAEAEDVVADCWLRLAAADERDPVRDAEAWLVVAVARAALDSLRSARSRREYYVGPWLPEPLVHEEAAAADPADRVTLDESVGYALLVVLERLTPGERTAFVLHDVFGMPFAEVAAAVGRTPAAVRQLASRARRRLRDAAPPGDVEPTEHARLVDRFLGAAAGGDLAGLVEVLDPEAELVSDGGGQVSAARRPVRGGDRVARFVAGLLTKYGDGLDVAAVSVNGLRGIVLRRDGRPDGVVAFSTARGRITRIHLIRNPDKLGRLDSRHPSGR